jgi:hypothetical protein
MYVEGLVMSLRSGHLNLKHVKCVNGVKPMRFLMVIASALFITACSKGGQLNLEPGAIKNKSEGSPFVITAQGAESLIVQQGQTPATGISGWITIGENINPQPLSSVSGHTMVINSPEAFIDSSN